MAAGHKSDGPGAGTGLYLTGDGLRIPGADGAEAAGALAANACLNGLGRATPTRHPDTGPVGSRQFVSPHGAGGDGRADPLPLEFAEKDGGGLVHTAAGGFGDPDRRRGIRPWGQLLPTLS